MPRKILILLLLFFALPSIQANSKTYKEPAPSPEDIQRFTTAISQIKHFYVKPTKNKTLFDNAIQGMLEGLDPHSTYLDPNEYEQLKSRTQGHFGGLGIEIDMHEGLVRVVSPIDDTPAARGGLKSGDLIFKINKKPVKGLNLAEAVKLMRGTPKTGIELSVIRNKKTFAVHLIREVIKIDSVKSKLIDGHYGYVRISHFQEPTSRRLEKAIKQLKKASGGTLKGIVLDLRNNPGGLLKSAIDVSNAFLTPNHHNDKIVYTSGRIPGASYEARATEGDIISNMPLAVLINEGSASASEIVAGALQDHQRAVIVGQKSFGKGSVQTILPLDKNHAVKLTTALYYTPKGRSIQARGIEPDVIVDNVQVSKKKSESFQFSESDLKGRIENKTQAKKVTSTPHVEGIERARKSELLYEDFQLYETVNLLQALQVLKEKRNSTDSLL